jgi:4-amino-4-deoxy-L-arabinose transferase-like glycosyltransferase
MTGGANLGARAYALLFLLALLARLAAVSIAGFSTVRFGDGPAYLFAARTLVETGRYPLQTEPFYFRAPGYPVFLALATLGHPRSVPLGKLATAAAGAAAVPILAAISLRLFRRRRLAIAAGAAAAIHPGFLYTSSDIQSEPLFLMLLAAAGFLLLAASDRPSSGLALGAGAATALAALTRPSALLLVPFLGAPLFDRRYPLRVRAHLAGSAAAGFLLFLSPWTLRNALVFRELLPINDAAGSAFYQGNSDWAVRFYGVRSREEYLRWVQDMHHDMTAQTAELQKRGRGSPTARSRYFFERALAERRGDPAGWARLLARKAWDWLRPYPTPWFWPKAVVAGIGALYTILFLFAGIGLARASRRGPVRFALLFLAATLAAHVAIIVVWRYRIPYWDPVLLLYGVAGAGDTLLSRWSSEPP